MNSKGMIIVGLLMVVMLGSIGMSEMERGSQAELWVVEEVGEECVGERIGQSLGIVELVGWKEGIGRGLRKGRTYRNPLRRYRVSKKIRMQLRRRIAGLERKATGTESVEREMRIEGSIETGRWG